MLMLSDANVKQRLADNNEFNILFILLSIIKTIFQNHEATFVEPEE